MVRERAKSPASRPSFETHRFATLLRMRTPAESESGGGTVMFTLMVRSPSLRVSNHEAEHAAILRDGASRLLRMRTPAASHQQVDQMRDQGNVCRRHRVVAQLVGADPGELLPLPRDHLAVPAPADVERHQKMKIIVSVAGKGQRGEAGLAHGDTDFLVQFADQRCFRTFAGLDLAAGKLPQARERLALRPLRDQHALVGVDQRAGDHQDEIDRHSGMRQPTSGLPEFGKYECPSRQQPTWTAQARNPYSRSWLWIPGSLVSLAPRNDERKICIL